MQVLQSGSNGDNDAAAQGAAAGDIGKSHDSVAVLSTTAAVGLIPGAAGDAFHVHQTEADSCLVT